MAVSDTVPYSSKCLSWNCVVGHCLWSQRLMVFDSYQFCFIKKIHKVCYINVIYSVYFVLYNKHEFESDTGSVL